jgi:hypothetical protein
MIKAGAYRIDFNYSPEPILGEARDGGKKIPRGAWNAVIIGRR